MFDLGFYERVIPIRSRAKHTAKKIIVGAVCALALIVWIISALISEAGFVSCFVVSGVIVAIPFAVSSFSASELEYSISTTSVSLSMIYNGKRRKELFYAEAEDIVFIAPNTPQNMDKAEELEPEEHFEALSMDENGLEEWLVVFKDDKDRNHLFVFEAESGIQKLLRQLKPSAMTLR